MDPNVMVADLTAFLTTCGVRDVHTRTVSTPVHRGGPVTTVWEASCRVIDESWVERTIVATAPDLAGALRRMTAAIDPAPVGEADEDTVVTTVGLACPKCGEHEHVAVTQQIVALAPLKRRSAVDPRDPERTVDGTTAVFYMDDPTDPGERCGLYISAEGFDDSTDDGLVCRRCGHEAGLSEAADAVICWGGTIDPVPHEVSTGSTYYVVAPRRPS